MNQLMTRTLPILLTLAVLFGLTAGCQVNRYQASVAQTRTVMGVDVRVEPAGNVFWQVNARNNGSAMVKLVWDESSYVTTTGESSRLIRGKTRVIDSGKAQPPTPIPPGASITEFCVPEIHAELAGSFVSPGVADPTKTGRIYLMFETGTTKQAWEAEVRWSRPEGKK